MNMKGTITNIFAREPDNITDRWYRIVRDRSDFIEVKQHICSLWTFFYNSGLNDPHFVSEFPVRLFHRWWEMEVAWFLYAKGYVLKSNSCGPDFICSKDGFDVSVEAVMCEPGDPSSNDYPAELIPGPHKTGEFKITHVDLPERERLELLRIRNSIEYKVKQYHQHREKGLIDPKTPYVIALSPVMIPDMVSDADGIPSVVKAVYPVGQIYLSFGDDSTKATSGGRSYRPRIQKHNSAEIYTNIFLPSSLREFYKGISGILYSASSFKSSQYLNTMTSTFVYVHNLVTDKPLRHCCFGEHMDFWIEEGDGEYLLKNNQEAN